MQAIILYLVLFAVILLISFTNKSKEGFVSFFGYDFNQTNDGTPAVFNTKNCGLPLQQPPSPDLAEAGVGNIQASPPPASNLPTAPLNNLSKAVPTPYRNPTMEPARYIRLLGVKEDLQAFFGFQAPLFDQTSDPTVQIPLTRARADMKELIDIQSVMERNPGLPSRINNKQLDDIQANLRYLQSILRDMTNSGAIRIEGFAGSITVDTPPPNETRATLQELQDFSTKVFAEMNRLQASGTTDPVITARVNRLQMIKAEVDEVIYGIKNGKYTSDTVPIYQTDIKAALPLLGNPTDPLPQILKGANLPPALANLFPGGLSPSDTEQGAQINNIVKGYMSQIFEGTSWGLDLGAKLNLQYDSPRSVEIRGKRTAQQDPKQQQGIVHSIDTGLPGVSMNITNYSDSPVPDYRQLETTPSDVKQSCGSQYTQGGRSTYEFGLPGASTDRMLPPPVSGGFDWETRAKQIGDQLRKRGMDPVMFGGLPPNAQIGPDFHWKGHVKMVCTRLEANADPGFPVTVGCPPSTWEGWKIQE